MKKKIFHPIFFILFFTFFTPLALGQCGNGSCETGENSCSCSVDCGVCTGPVPGSSCKEYLCSAENQCIVSDLQNCCGNSICEASENYASCTVDCVPKTIAIEIISPTFSKVVYGEQPLIKVQILGDGRGITGAQINASGFFGKTSLENDGQHEDDKPADSFYANTIQIPALYQTGEQEILLEASFRGVLASTKIKLFIEPQITIDLKAVKEIFLTDNFPIKGKLTLKDNPLSAPVKISVKSIDGKELFSQSTVSDANGEFSAEFQTSLLDPLGKWIINIESEDTFSNKGVMDLEVLARPPEEKPPAEIAFILPPKAEYSFSEKLEFSVAMIDRQGRKIPDATIKLLLPNKDEVILAQAQRAVYSTSTIVPRGIGTGLKEFVINAIGFVDGVEVRTSKIFRAEISTENFLIEIIEPNKISYPIGSKLDIEVKVKDSAANPVDDAIVKALIGPSEITLNIEERGTYRSSVIVDEDFNSNQIIFFSIADKYGNQAFDQTKIKVEGKEFFYDLIKNLAFIGIAFAVILVLGIVLLLKIRSKSSFESLIRKKIETENFIKKTQELYFHDRTLSKEEYTASIEKYQKELGEIDKKIRDHTS